jgi:hypothetical protein
MLAIYIILSIVCAIGMEKHDKYEKILTIYMDLESVKEMHNFS